MQDNPRPGMPAQSKFLGKEAKRSARYFFRGSDMLLTVFTEDKIVYRVMWICTATVPKDESVVYGSMLNTCRNLTTRVQDNWRLFPNSLNSIRPR